MLQELVKRLPENSAIVALLIIFILGMRYLVMSIKILNELISKMTDRFTSTMEVLAEKHDKHISSLDMAHNNVALRLSKDQKEITREFQVEVRENREAFYLKLHDLTEDFSHNLIAAREIFAKQIEVLAKEHSTNTNEVKERINEIKEYTDKSTATILNSFERIINDMRRNLKNDGTNIQS